MLPRTAGINIKSNHIGANSMNTSTSKMRTVKVNDRGQLVIPEDMRRDLGIEGDTVLVLVERGDHIILRREADVLDEFDRAWAALSRRSIEGAWEEEDEAWDAHREEG